jgi:hypothetical protein
MQLFYPNIRWSLTQKNLFRFLFVFILLNIFPFPISAFLFFLPLEGYYYELLDTVVPFFGHTILGICKDFNFDFEPSGSGDKAVNYIYIFIFFLASVISWVIWSILDRKRKSYDTLFHYFLIACRYYLGVTLLGYGWEKVFHLQMPHISLNQLLQPVGDQTPMGLAWKFVGFSEAYSSFSGWAEVIPGILLLFRRTTLIGALIALAVMTNVMMMNYAFDIPVKLYSTLLVVFSLIIISPNIKRLLDIFIFHRTAQAVEYKPLFNTRGLRITRLVLKGAMLIYGIGFSFYGAYAAGEEYGDDVKPPLYGVYKTQVFVKNNDTIPLYSDSTIWKNMVFNRAGFIVINKFSDKRLACFLETDTVKQTLQIKPMSDSTCVYKLTYQRVNDSIYKFKGISPKDTFEIISKRLARNHFTLYKKGFNWVNEKPDNR